MYTNFDYSLKGYFEIDSLGYLGKNREVDRESELLDGCINSEELVINLATEFLQNYSSFVGLNDASSLVIRRIQGTPRLEEKKNKWLLQFENQVYDGIEVFDNQIGIYVSPRGVYEVFGHWYPTIHLPEEVDVSFGEAKSSLMGKTFTWIGMAGGVDHTLTIDDFTKTGTRKK